MQQTLSKRNRIALWAERTGLLSILPKLPQKPSLVVLTYHRIGDSSAQPYDPLVFGPDVDEFANQVKLLSQTCDVVTLNDALEFVEGSRRFKRTAVLCTFDDGYIDNYELAYPILKRYSIPASFFLATSFTAGSAIPWWDQVAYMLRQTDRTHFTVEYPAEESFDLSVTGLEATLLRLYRLFKSDQVASESTFLQSLSAATGVTCPTVDKKLFLDWTEAKEMARNGYSIGSHTCSHATLSKLSLQQQLMEMTESRSEIERQIDVPCTTLAYPYGLRHNVNRFTQEAVAQAGYRAAFSFYGGINYGGQINRLDVCRVPVLSNAPLARFRLQLGAASMLGSWF